MKHAYLMQGPERAAVAQELTGRYRAGDTILGIARAEGRSYGATRDLLLEAGVTLRPRGARRIGSAAPA